MFGFGSEEGGDGEEGLGSGCSVSAAGCTVTTTDAWPTFDGFESHGALPNRVEDKLLISNHESRA